jgi:hypothetical protein
MVGRQIRVRETDEAMKIQKKKKEGDSMNHRNKKCIENFGFEI